METFQDARLVGHAPGGQDRYRSLLQAAINVWQERHDLPPVKLKPIPFDNQRIRFLSHAERGRLIYVDHDVELAEAGFGRISPGMRLGCRRSKPCPSKAWVLRSVYHDIWTKLTAAALRSS